MHKGFALYAIIYAIICFLEPFPLSVYDLIYTPQNKYTDIH